MEQRRHFLWPPNESIPSPFTRMLVSTISWREIIGYLAAKCSTVFSSLFEPIFLSAETQNNKLKDRRFRWQLSLGSST